jgi:putative DNA primase/helicase
LWQAFLWKTFGGNPDLVTFVQRMCGYALTGLTNEHALFFCFGTGANGKSTFINTVVGVLGDYACIAPVETFTASTGDRHPTELAMLMGARLVTAQETEEGRPWAEAKIKTVTGGDPISARRMRQDFFTFTPQLKLIIAGNHRPSVRTVDEAIRRRIHIIPFMVTIPPGQRDPKLPEKLKAEWPGILAWMVEGCLLWQKQGLNPPSVIRDATTEYLDAEDIFQLWLDECCEEDPDAWESSASLFGSWKLWAGRNGEPTRSMRRLSQALEAKGFKKKPTNKARGFSGMRLKTAQCA